MRPSYGVRVSALQGSQLPHCSLPRAYCAHTKICNLDLSLIIAALLFVFNMACILVFYVSAAGSDVLCAFSFE